MIVQCPKCSSRYRIREEKLPPAGGRIKCPNCAHAFHVERKAEAPAPIAESPRVSSPTSTPSPFEQLGLDAKAELEALTADLEKHLDEVGLSGNTSAARTEAPAEAPAGPGRGGSMGTLALGADQVAALRAAAPPAQPAPPVEPANDLLAPPSGPSADATLSLGTDELQRAAEEAASFVTRGPRVPAPAATIALVPAAEPAPPATEATASPKARGWKLRNPVGLTYDFGDLDALRRWLGTRDSFEGLDVSGDGGNTWKPVSSTPELADLGPGGAAPVARAATQRLAAVSIPTSAPAPAPDDLREQAQKRLEESRAKRGVTAPPAAEAAAPAPAPAKPSRDPRKPQGPASGKGKRYNRLLRGGADEDKGLPWGMILAAAALLFLGLEASGTTSITGWFKGPAPAPTVVVPGASLAPAAGSGAIAASAVPREIPLGPIAPEATELIERASVTFDELVEAARTFTSQADHSSSIAVLLQAREINPDDPAVACQLANAYLATGRVELARKEAQTCRNVDLSPREETAGTGDEEGTGELGDDGTDSADDGEGTGDDLAAAPTGEEPAAAPDADEPPAAADEGSN